MSSQAARALKLYVGNLPWTVGHSELREYFSRFGHVKAVRVIFDPSTGFSRRYGFVTFSSNTGFENVTKRKSHILEGNVLTLDTSS